VRWLVVSIVLSVVLTVVLNLAARALPTAGRRAARWLDDLEARAPERSGRVRLYVPWRAMLLASLVLTVGLNIVLWLV
jgi:hypothetical protein